MATKTQENGAVVNRLPARKAREDKRVRVTIRGLLPGLLYQGKGVMEADSGEVKRTKPRTAAEEAELRAHWTGDGKGRQLCIPWVNLYKAICAAAGSFKFRGNKTMASVVAGTIACEEDRVPLGSDKYEVYEEWVRIPPRIGSMVKIGRPRVRAWQASFTMVVDDEMYNLSALEAILRHAGKMIGVGAWRPELKGPYGRFEVAEFRTL